MHCIKKTVIVTTPAEVMFNLISDVANYQTYLPWCTRSKILTYDPQYTIGTIYIKYFNIKTHFTTKNINIPFQQIRLHLVDGPFKHLQGLWNFTPLGDSGCKVELNLEYKFANKLLEKILAPMFEYISNNIIQSFIQEAQKCTLK